MDDASLYTLNANAGIQVGEPDGQAKRHDKKFSLGSKAKDVYSTLSAANRQPVVDMGREMASITIPSVMPPLGYRVGNDLPGTNQSVGARAVNSLASCIMFTAFPPGLPMMRLKPKETAFQAQELQDPDLYSQVELALSRVELVHREKAATIQLATAWVGYIKLLIVAGNALWKHVHLQCPTFHPLTQFACSRDMKGHPMLTIHEEIVRVATLDKDVQEIIYREKPELLKTEEWTRETTIFSVCRYIRHPTHKGMYEDGNWEYWEETEMGQLLPGSSVETDYDDPPMWPGWMIPVYGQNYGRSYCEEYRGDLFILENGHSGLNDGVAMASLALMFVKPGGRTSLRQVQNAKNLAMLSGVAEDVSTFKAEKTNDLKFALEHVQMAAERINQAFLVDRAKQRDAERVTAEEVEQVQQELDRAMGGLYTEVAQSHQRIMVTRFVRLHEEADPDIPEMDPNLVAIQVMTGADAMGRSVEQKNLMAFGQGINTVFPPNSQTTRILDPWDFSRRLASTMSIKPDGLVLKQEDVEAKEQQQQQTAQQGAITQKAVGPAIGPMAKAMASHMDAANMQQQQGQQQPSPQQPPGAK